MSGLSTVAVQWESLFNLYATIGWVVGGAVIGWIIYNMTRYRSKPGAKEPEDAPRNGRFEAKRGTVRVALVLTVIITVILFGLTIGTFQSVDLIEHPPAKGTIVVKVEGFQWGWKFIYPNGKEVIGELRVPKGDVIVLDVTSTDVFHNFGILGFKVKADAIPGKVNRIWIDPTTSGSYDILCFEFCGAGHSFMKGQLTVMEPGQFDAWYGSA